MRTIEGAPFPTGSTVLLVGQADPSRNGPWVVMPRPRLIRQRDDEPDAAYAKRHGRYEDALRGAEVHERLWRATGHSGHAAEALYYRDLATRLRLGRLDAPADGGPWGLP